MLLDAIHLVQANGTCFAIDRRTCSPIVLSETAYRTLSGLKGGRSLEEIEKALGTERVKTVLSQLSNLEREGFIGRPTRSPSDEARAFVDDLERRSPNTLEAVFMIAQQCNLACRYCYGRPSGTFGGVGRMTEAVAEECLRYFLSIGRGHRFQKVVFMGGEPLLALPVIRHVVGLWDRWRDEYSGRDLYFSMTTNGTLLTPEIIGFLKRHSIAITVSIDGPEQLHDANRCYPDGKGSFQRVMAGIALLREAGARFSVRATLTRQSDLERVCYFFAKQGFSVEYLIPVDFPQAVRTADYQLDADDLQRLQMTQQALWKRGCHDVVAGRDTFDAKQLSVAFHNLKMRPTGFPFRCWAGWGLIAFDRTGAIYPCHRFVGQAAYQIGDARAGLDRSRVIALYRRFINASHSCDECWALPLCRRRCLNQRATSDGSFGEIPEPICDAYRENCVSSIGFAVELAPYADNPRVHDALSRYDSDRLMREMNDGRGS